MHVASDIAIILVYLFTEHSFSNGSSLLERQCFSDNSAYNI